MPQTPSLKDFRRIVVKVGSSLLVDAAAGSLKRDWLASLAADIAALHKEKRDIIVVSSGAIALGRAVLKLPAGPLKLEDSQAAAAVGQIALARSWSESLSAHAIAAGQVLLTLGGTLEIAARFPDGAVTIAPEEKVEPKLESAMKKSDHVSLHRKRPETSVDRMITEGPEMEVLRQFNNIRPSERNQYSMMRGGVVYNHLEIENILREANLDNEDT